MKCWTFKWVLATPLHSSGAVSSEDWEIQLSCFFNPLTQVGGKTRKLMSTTWQRLRLCSSASVYLFLTCWRESYQRIKMWRWTRPHSHVQQYKRHSALHHAVGIKDSCSAVYQQWVESNSFSFWCEICSEKKLPLPQKQRMMKRRYDLFDKLL